MVVHDIIGVKNMGLGKPFCVCGLMGIPLAFEIECMFFGTPFVFSIRGFKGRYVCNGDAQWFGGSVLPSLCIGGGGMGWGKCVVGGVVYG